MADGALFVRWGAPIAGREIMALDVFNETKAFADTLVKRGEITSFEPCLLSHAGDEMRGFFLLCGDPLKLATLTMREDFVKLAAKAALVVENVVIVPAAVGETVSKMLDVQRAAAKALMLQPV